jgi:hypothetical protein
LDVVGGGHFGKENPAQKASMVPKFQSWLAPAGIVSPLVKSGFGMA